MKLIVGLGNPGPKYQITRHNIGFLLIDSLLEVGDEKRRFKNEFKSETQKITVDGSPVLVCKPQTFMNLSGEAVAPLMKFYNIMLSDLLVIHDEVDQPFASMKFQIRRGHGGHNGVRNLHQVLGTDDYARLRLGVGRPPMFVDDNGERTRPTMEVADWVLHNFSNEEQQKLPDFLALAIQGVQTWVAHGTSKAATQFNGS